MRKPSAHGHPDHDACGTGFITRLGQPASHEVVERALVALARLSHRGGVDADGASGDGAGLLTAIPQKFCRRLAAERGIQLPFGFALGMLFLAPDEQTRVQCRMEILAHSNQLQFLGWREVPIDSAAAGARAAETLPAIWQCFLAPENEADDFESRLFFFRKQAEAELGPAVYFCSLSSRTVVYKGLLAPRQLPLFYPDLQAADFESEFAIFHQRFSTNTQPAWRLAQPFRFLAHNGEINTIVGNRRWMFAREAELRRRLQVGEWFHGLEENVSDSASLDNALELLVRQGQSPDAGLLTLVPPAFESDSAGALQVREYLEAAAAGHEPWDGPAALVFSDGRMIGAKLDRNGLRPLRYTRTADGWLLAGSEAGLGNFDNQTIVERQRLGPGEMLVVDLRTGKTVHGGEALRQIASRNGQKNSKRPSRLPSAIHGKAAAIGEPERVAAALGWSEDQFRLLLQPLAGGKEGIWSMGDDAPPAFMSTMRRTVWDYCKQRFAQVTNPAIDPLREAHVMSLETRIGREFITESPVLGSPQLLFLQECFTPCPKIDVTFPATAGVAGALEALKRIRNEVQTQGKAGRRLVVLSDRRVNEERAALPMLLATAAAWRAMVEAGNCHIPLVVETAQVIDTHHLALLLAVGATAVCPFLAIQLAEKAQTNGAANYCKALDAGLRKVLSRMGISTIASYRNGQLFEVVGLDEQVCAEFFESADHVAEATSLEQLIEDYLETHALAFNSNQSGLKDAGLYRYRKEGERHATSPELLRKLHAYIKTREPGSYRQYEELVAGREPVAVRDLLKVVGGEAVEISKVESEKEILQRFSTQAMSIGALSAEAHRTLALAMNQLGARSNTGEGGEDPELYSREPEAACKVKQVASGRFGVTTQYLVHAEEIEIKIAQGSKPGEGGQLPAAKVTPYIARLRRAVPGMSLISPPPHHDIYSIEDLEQLIHDVREVNPNARIGVKLVSGAGVGVIAAGVAKAGADVITISGHDGGTGASPLSSIKNTGLPWEFGLRDVHRTLVESGLRQQVRLRVDGGLKFARDVLVAALLGADEFGFGTAALLAIGCVMARQCHLNTCPVGIATQDEALRARFAGKPEMVMAYFRAMVAEVRALLAGLGARSIGEIVGRVEHLQPRNEESSGWVQDLLQLPAKANQGAAKKKNPRGLSRVLTTVAVRKSGVLQRPFRIVNSDRSIGAYLSGELLRHCDGAVYESPLLDLEFEGVAGQSFGAFLIEGLSFHLRGEANDYVGKGLSGGTIAVHAGEEASCRGDVLAGNTVLYGATSGELYVAGRAGERFAVRNSGALAVVEGVGDHGCEYMTGGIVLMLGPAGTNLGSGMTGGLVYVLEDYVSEQVVNLNFVRRAPCSEAEDAMLRRVLERHFELTASPVASSLLQSTRRLPMARIEPLQLPCSLEQTWAPVIQRLAVAESPAVVQLPDTGETEVVPVEMPGAMVRSA